ncbi:SWIM zinc finger family protein [Primorskyibacter flagellatus]|uniref:SWIM zinc finger family protein n=1 Tax=Primorskyibacter flagellatus TaxID=1387277 RepID=UPI003A8EC6D9
MNFVVRSKSSGNEYNVQVYSTDDGPVITCDCPAGENGQYCKHRFALISGDEREVVEADAQVREIAALVAGSR